jgi:hypothetical protein
MVILLNQLRDINVEAVRKNGEPRVEIIPFDTYAFYSFRQSIEMMKILFPNLETNPEMNALFSPTKKSIRGYRRKVEYLVRLNKELSKNLVLNQLFTPKQKEIIILAMQHYQKDYELFNFNFSEYREDFLANHVLAHLDSSKINLVFCGANHAYKSSEIQLFDSHFSLASQVWRYLVHQEETDDVDDWDDEDNETEESKSREVNHLQKDDSLLVQSIKLVYLKPKDAMLESCYPIGTQKNGVFYLYRCEREIKAQGYDRCIVLNR